MIAGSTPKVVLAGLLLLAGVECSSKGCNTTEKRANPSTRGAFQSHRFEINVLRQRESVVFAFSECDRTDTMPQVLVVQVLRESETGEYRPICVLSSNEGRGDFEVGEEWKYGAPKEGGEISGRCPPFKTGNYAVSAFGGGTGERWFEIQESGELVVDRSLCGPDEADARPRTAPR